MPRSIGTDPDDPDDACQDGLDQCYDVDCSLYEIDPNEPLYMHCCEDNMNGCVAPQPQTETDRALDGKRFACSAATKNGPTVSKASLRSMGDAIQRLRELAEPFGGIKGPIDTNIFDTPKLYRCYLSFRVDERNNTASSIDAIGEGSTPQIAKRRAQTQRRYQMSAYENAIVLPGNRFEELVNTGRLPVKCSIECQTVEGGTVIAYTWGSNPLTACAAAHAALFKLADEHGGINHGTCKEPVLSGTTSLARPATIAAGCCGSRVAAAK